LNNRTENFPIFVAEANQIVTGYIALNKWSERKAYDITAEVSLYVHRDYRAQGIGKMLLECCVDYAQKSTKLNSLIARISEGNEQSIYMHKMQKFEVMGVMKQAGIKFGKHHDVLFMQRMLR
jgi:phosphinothricin acetyltransferase